MVTLMKEGCVGVFGTNYPVERHFWLEMMDLSLWSRQARTTRRTWTSSTRRSEGSS